MPCKIVRKKDDLTYIIRDPWRSRGVMNIEASVTKIIPFHPWGEDAREWLEEMTSFFSRGKETGEEKEIGLQNNDDRDVRVGDMVIINTKGGRAPFAVARVLEMERDTGNFVVQWHGNRAGNALGSWKPGWIDRSDGAPFYDTSYKGTSKDRKYMFTNESVKGKAEVNIDMISLWDFELTAAFKLTTRVLREMDKDTGLDWILPEKFRPKPKDTGEY